MTDKRILHFPRGWNPDENDPSRPLYDSLHARESDVSAMHPLEIWLDREFLIAETHAAIDAAKRHVPWESATPLQRDHLKAVLQQRAEFLEYLNSETTERVYLAVYPMSTDPSFGFGEEVGADETPPFNGGDYGSLGRLDNIEHDDDLPL